MTFLYTVENLDITGYSNNKYFLDNINYESNSKTKKSPNYCSH